jgi:hypothetical protein
VPYKLVGLLVSTQTTAGTWATAPSTIQGYGIAQQGQTVPSAQLFLPPSGTAWTLPTRTSGTTYTNTSSWYKLVYVNLNATTGSTVTVGGVLIHNQTNSAWMQVSFIVPPNATYVATAGSGFSTWAELG